MLLLLLLRFDTRWPHMRSHLSDGVDMPSVGWPDGEDWLSHSHLLHTADRSVKKGPWAGRQLGLLQRSKLSIVVWLSIYLFICLVLWGVRTLLLLCSSSPLTGEYYGNRWQWAIVGQKIWVNRKWTLRVVDHPNQPPPSKGPKAWIWNITLCPNTTKYHIPLQPESYQAKVLNACYG
jgi:hypothetical protein